jgi:predicted alpha/beta superfamily hydrolase
MEGERRIMARQAGLTISGPAIGFSSDHFEIDSRLVGSKFSIAVTLPPGYSEQSSRRYPVLYATDTFTNCAFTIGANNALLGDRLRPVQPYILVNIGYADNDFRRSLTRRNREFVPPGEEVPVALERHIEAPAYASVLGGEEGHKEFMDYARNGRADNFLAFFEKELHPEIVRRFNVDGDNAGLFGHSYGGLFALYVFTSGSSLFNRICAASPGVISDQSVIFGRYDKLAKASVGKPRDIDLYVTMSDLEIMGDLEVYRRVGIGTLRFVDHVLKDTLPGLRFGRSIVPDETHFSIVYEAFRRFVRFSYAPEG